MVLSTILFSGFVKSPDSNVFIATFCSVIDAFSNRNTLFVKFLMCSWKRELRNRDIQVVGTWLVRTGNNTWSSTCRLLRVVLMWPLMILLKMMLFTLQVSYSHISCNVTYIKICNDGTVSLSVLFRRERLPRDSRTVPSLHMFSERFCLFCPWVFVHKWL